MSSTCTLVGLIVFECVQAAAPADPVPPVARYCQTASLVRYSAQDTPETRRQLRVANARYRAACGDIK